MDNDRREARDRTLATAFALIEDGIAKFGSALGAMDHGGDAAVPQLESEGHDLIRAAFALAPELDALLPDLRSALLANLDLADQGFDIRSEMEVAKRRLNHP